MQELQTGQFFGQTNQTITSKGYTLTDTVYTHNYVDWHYHKNAYFTFLLEGKLLEGNTKETFKCDTGALLFHNCQEAHYNIKPKGHTRGFHIELDNDWMNTLSINLDELQGNFNIQNPSIRLLLYQIFKESKVKDDASTIALDSLVIQLLAELCTHQNVNNHTIPKWVKTVEELLYDSFSEKLSLDKIARTVGIHPVHLSRDFSKYFNCTLGDFLRKIKVEKALALISNSNLSLTEIAYDCNFSDQSHFIRCFKKNMGLTPFKYRKVLSAC